MTEAIFMVGSQKWHGKSYAYHVYQVLSKSRQKFRRCGYKLSMFKIQGIYQLPYWKSIRTQNDSGHLGNRIKYKIWYISYAYCVSKFHQNRFDSSGDEDTNQYSKFKMSANYHIGKQIKHKLCCAQIDHMLLFLSSFMKIFLWFRRI